MYIYIGEITSVDTNGKSYFSDANGKACVMTGGKVGELAVWNSLRKFYIAMDKKVWQDLGGSLVAGSVVEVGLPSSSDVGTLQAQIAGLQAEIARLNAQISSGSAGSTSSPDQNAQIAALNAQIAGLQKQLAQAGNSDTATLHQQIATLEAQLTEKTRIAESLRVELEALKKQSVRSDDDVTGDGGFL